jgi:hypothetical protein
MPEVRPRPRQHVIAAAMLLSAVVMFAMAMLFFTGTIDVGEDLRMIAGSVVAVAAAADLAIAIWFFRRGQSS